MPPRCSQPSVLYIEDMVKKDPLPMMETVGWQEQQAIWQEQQAIWQEQQAIWQAQQAVWKAENDKWWAEHDKWWIEHEQRMAKSKKWWTIATVAVISFAVTGIFRIIRG